LPSGGEWVEFTSPLPADLEAALARLRQSARAAVRRVSS
jgi:23S rRNA pseudouridine1911/1915/1917 synthase